MSEDYDAQAEKFLKNTGTIFSAKFLRHDKYFPDDKESRDIYEITLQRGERKYVFNFGQSVAASGEYIFYSAKNGKMRIHLETSRTGKKILRYDGEFLNSGNSQKNKDFAIPTAYDVLACMTKNEPGSFEDFCSEYGYDTDSRQAEKTYNAVVKEYNALCTLYSEKELNQMTEIQ